jgi:predicted nicotinamide N-methyase
MTGSPSTLRAHWDRHRTQLIPVRIGRADLELYELSEGDPIVVRTRDEGLAGRLDLPFWTMLWPASLVLGRFVSQLEAGPGKVMLELGAGLGLVGLVAAAHGHRVVISDHDLRALRLARASAQHNLLDRVSFVAFDWRRPCLARAFDFIVGAEILYRPVLYPVLAELLRTHLTPGGHAYLALSERPFAVAFFDLIRQDFQVRCRRFTLHDDQGNDERILLYEVADKNGELK